MLRRLRESWFNFLYGNRKENIAGGKEIMAANIRRWFKDCPVCQLGFEGHQLGVFAVTANTPETNDRAELFLATLREHRWSDAVGFQEFDPFSDALVAYALRCPSRQFAVIVTHEPYEPDFDAPSVFGYEIIDAKIGEELAALIDQRYWFSLGAQTTDFIDTQVSGPPQISVTHDPILVKESDGDSTVNHDE